MTQYTLVVATATGKRIAEITKFASLSWGRTVNAPGYFELEVSPTYFPRSLFAVDGQIQIWRKPPYYKRQLVTVGLMQYLKRSNRDGFRTALIKGPDLVDLLDTRIIASPAASAGADKSDTADDVMKQYVREALGALADSTRSRSTYFSVDADANLGPSITKSASRDRLLETLRNIGETAYQKGTPVYFDVVMGTTGPIFRTYLYQRGVDRSGAVTLSEAKGTLANVSLEQDWRGEINFVYGAGEGAEAARVVVTVEDAARSGMSIWHRREGFFDGKNYKTSTGLTDAASQRVRQGRPRRVFEGDLINRLRFQYGVHWAFGDKVRALYDDEQYTVQVVSVMGTVSGKGKEVIRARLRYEE